MASRRTGKLRIRKAECRNNRSLRLLVEPLEARRLLAGIQVSVYLDDNGSRDFNESSDMPAANRLVYVDLNRDGAYDPGEPVKVTGPDGSAFFENLASGDYSVGLITNPDSQPQVEPTRVAGSASQVSAVASQRLIHNADLSIVWSADSAGRLTPLSGVESLDGGAIDLDSAVTASIARADNSAWLVYGDGKLANFDLTTGQYESFSIANLEVGAEITKLVQTETSTIAFIRASTGNSLAELTITDGVAELQAGVPTNADQIVGSVGSPLILAISSDEYSSSVEILNLGSDYGNRSSILLTHSVSEAVLSQDGQTLALATPDGGRVFAVTPNTLTLVAMLAEATGPFAADSVDGRLITGNSSNPRELIVWDTNAWQPIGRTSIPSGSVLSVASSRRGHVAIARSEDSVERLDLAVPETQPVTVDSDNAASVRLGVQVVGENTAPDVSGANGVRQVTEDTLDAIDWRAAGVSDADGDTLWFTVENGAKHGTLSLASDGSWNYQPRPDYNGSDSAIIRVHDGQTTTQLRVSWDVTPVNDPPLSMSIETQPLPENSPAGTEFGFVSIVDADRDAAYRVTTSDPRFTVENGRIFLASGSVDFESEANLRIRIEAIDQTDDSIRISSEAVLVITDVDEPPSGIRLTALAIEENAAGATVGTVEVEDPDAANDFEFLVSDPRFFVDGNVLKLADSESLNFEQESSIDLKITARDRNSDFEEAADFVLSVIDLDDAPTAITLSRLEVEELSDGVIVGEVNVVDEDNDVYDFSVSDERFEVVDSTLKLRDGVQLDDGAEQLSLTILAKARGGGQLSGAFPLQVVPPRSPWQNPANPNDVNGDGDVSPIDVLLLINELNKDGARPLPATGGGGTGESPRNHPDVNGDGVLSPLDVLLIINELNRRRSDGEGEADLGHQELASGELGPAESGLHIAGSGAFCTPEANDRRKMLDSEIDAELELLLDHISRERLGS